MKSRIPYLKNKSKRTVDTVIYRVSNRSPETPTGYNLEKIKTYQKPLTIEELKNKLNKN